MILFAASLGDTITDGVYEVAKAFRYPVLILALVALAAAVYEVGRLTVEYYMRRQRSQTKFELIAADALLRIRSGDPAGGQAVLRSYAHGASMQQSLVGVVSATSSVDAQRAIVQYDLTVSRRLDRVRLLVRSGPALGLMGTLIPLAPALAALGKGNAKTLADELQTAFAITVVGVAVGLIAFMVALVRERLYSRDLADLEYIKDLRGGELGAPAPVTITHAPVTASASTPVQSSGQSATPTEPAASNQPIAAAPSAAATTAISPAPNAAPVVVAPPAVAAPVAEKKRKFGLKKKSAAVAPPSAVAPAPIAPAPIAPVDADKRPQIGSTLPTPPDPVSPSASTPASPPAKSDDKTSEPSGPADDK